MVVLKVIGIVFAISVIPFLPYAACALINLLFTKVSFLNRFPDFLRNEGSALAIALLILALLITSRVIDWLGITIWHVLIVLLLGFVGTHLD